MTSGPRVASATMKRSTPTRMASEAGVLQLPAADVVRKGRLQPGRMFLVDTKEGRIIEDDEIKRKLATARPWREWVAGNQVALDALADPPGLAARTGGLANRGRTAGAGTGASGRGPHAANGTRPCCY